LVGTVYGVFTEAQQLEKTIGVTLGLGELYTGSPVQPPSERLTDDVFPT
jgi:hypothetical protein